MCMHAYVQMYAVSQIQSVRLEFQHALGVKNTEGPKNTVGKCHRSSAHGGGWTEHTQYKTMQNQTVFNMQPWVTKVWETRRLKLAPVHMRNWSKVLVTQALVHEFNPQNPI